MAYAPQSWNTGDQVTAVELTDLSGAVVSASSGIADMSIDPSTSHLQVTLADGDLVDAGAVPAASDATVAPILQDTASTSYAAAQAAAHAALDTAIAGKVTKGSISRDVLDFGAVGDGMTDDTAAVSSALAALPTAGGRVLFGGQRKYAVSQIAVPNQNITLEIQTGSQIVRPSTSTQTGPIILVQRSFTHIVGGGTILCQNACPQGVVRIDLGSTPNEWSRIDGVHIQGPGATVSGSVGVVVNGSAAFQNRLAGTVVSHVETGVVNQGGANMNHFTDVDMYNIGLSAWVFDGTLESTVVGGSISASANVTVLAFTGSATHNRVLGFAAEPGGTSATFFSFGASTSDNQIIGGVQNTAKLGTDSGSNNSWIINGQCKFGQNMMGFFGAAPAVRPALTSSSTVADVVAALKSLGLSS